MALVSIRNSSIAFGGPPVLEAVNLQIEHGERVCIVGRNGEGKSTLMKLLSGDLTPDCGEVWLRPATRVAILDQEVPLDITGKVFEVIRAGLPATSEDWQSQHPVEKLIDQMELDAEADFAFLSAGMKRRVLLARKLAGNPDLLLLDEPTNHLDIPAINWLENFLQRFDKTLVFVTHDRVFLQKLAGRIIEIDRGRVSDWACDYVTWLQRKDELLANEEKEQALFDSKLAQEEVWVRQGIKARRKRSQARVRKLEEMRNERRNRRLRPGDVALQVQEAEKSGKLVIRAAGVDYGYDGAPLINDFSATIVRGDRIGIIGPNGSGKSTLLKLLLGQLQPRRGEIRQGVRLQIAYFDQLRSQLDEEQSVQESIGEGKMMIDINGQSRHVIGYLQDFLFSPDRARSPVKSLSGGERNRLLLARLFTRPSNLLVMDEPTNDLDIETLELLEERLLEYPGTLLVVSHDREFLNQVVTSTLAFENDGQVKEYVGGYNDWLRQSKLNDGTRPPAGAAKTPGPATDELPRSNSKRAGAYKLSNKERAELASLPLYMETLEAEQQSIIAQLSDPAFYQTRPMDAAGLQQRIEAIKAELEVAFERWAELEELGGK